MFKHVQTDSNSTNSARTSSPTETLSTLPQAPSDCWNPALQIHQIPIWTSRSLVQKPCLKYLPTFSLPFGVASLKWHLPMAKFLLMVSRKKSYKRLMPRWRSKALNRWKVIQKDAKSCPGSRPSQKVATGRKNKPSKKFGKQTLDFDSGQEDVYSDDDWTESEEAQPGKTRHARQIRHED